MSLLLDTHAALWYALGDGSLTQRARAAIDAESERRYVSAASYWEIAIKISLGKYALSVPFLEFWNGAMDRCGYTVLPIEIRHAEKLLALPMHHRDPFDRIIIAQSLCDNLLLVSNDGIADKYNVARVW